MRLIRNQVDHLLANSWVALGKSDYEESKFQEILNEDYATLYEIGRLFAAELSSGKGWKRDGVFDYIEIDAFTVYAGCDFHASKQGKHVDFRKEKRSSEY